MRYPLECTPVPNAVSSDDNNSNLSLWQILVIALILLVIALAVLFAFKRKASSKDESDSSGRKTGIEASFTNPMYESTPAFVQQGDEALYSDPIDDDNSAYEDQANFQVSDTAAMPNDGYLDVGGSTADSPATQMPVTGETSDEFNGFNESVDLSSDTHGFEIDVSL